MGTDDRTDPHLGFLEMSDRLMEDLAVHNLKARERLREGIAWLEARRADANEAEHADIEILVAQCHDALKRMEALRGAYQDVRAINAAAHAEHLEWLDKRILGGTESPGERAERQQRLERLREERQARMGELRRRAEDAQRPPQTDGEDGSR
ncbi:hypothetical protein [Glycomyces albidus]|uniref:Uncharacterized protein n=1 Tax=Glycomyces albidus TaxID=2656774 RepID=A0A6L5G3F4_9ACTN|nr:hypothetical protein [Glycomyces albidus]MQM24165.1 hypothetical protein [Glycomyces albidus]